MNSTTSEYEGSIAREKPGNKPDEDTVEVARSVYHTMLASAQREQELQDQFQIGFNDLNDILTESSQEEMTQIGYAKNVLRDRREEYHLLEEKLTRPPVRNPSNASHAQTQQPHQQTDQVPSQYVSEEVLKTLNVIRWIRSLNTTSDNGKISKWYSYILDIYESEEYSEFSHDDILLILEAVQETQANDSQRVKTMLSGCTESLTLPEYLPFENSGETWSWSDLQMRLNAILNQYETLFEEMSGDNSEVNRMKTNYAKAILLTHLKKLNED